jgi:hypothetical protein
MLAERAAIVNRREVELFLVGNPHFTTRHWATTEPFRDAAAVVTDWVIRESNATTVCVHAAI